MKVLLALFVAVRLSKVSSDGLFEFWLDPASSGSSNAPPWWATLNVASDVAFTNANGTRVDVNYEDHAPLHLYADHQFRDGYDDVIRKLNGVSESRGMTGTIDSCGWPWTRRSTPYVEDFSGGLNPDSLVVATTYKSCCDVPTDVNVNMTTDVIDGIEVPVLSLTAWNRDACTGTQCIKVVHSAGMVETADMFASGRYEVTAKVPAALGLVWAIWTFHYEQHLPVTCSRYTCYCGNGGSSGCPYSQCMPPSVYYADNCVMHDGLPCANDTLCDSGYSGSDEQLCGEEHAAVGSDPLFIKSTSFSGYLTQLNHEIDIEIPASCMETSNVCPSTCAGDYSTANLNNYLYTNNGGGGNAYLPACVKATDKSGSPVQFLGDGKYHTYAFEWHTGNTSVGGNDAGRVDFFIDGEYLGTNNAFVPTRASRFAIAHWPGSWNGQPNSWGGGHPGDGKVYSQTALVSRVAVTPFNEPNDIMYMGNDDQPDGCAVPYFGNACHRWTPVTIPPPGPATCPSANKPNGCPCGHSWECASNWCHGTPSTCQQPS